VNSTVKRQVNIDSRWEELVNDISKVIVVFIALNAFGAAAQEIVEQDISQQDMVTRAGDDNETNLIEIEDPFAPRYIVESIEIKGNDKTQGKFIISHLLLKPGQLLDEEKVEFSRIRLLSLGYFHDVQMLLEKGSERGRVKLIVEVDERNTIIVDDVFMGLSKTNPFWGGAGISEINFLGRGMILSGGLVASEHQQAYRLSWFWPSVMLSKFNVGIQILYSNARELDLGNSDSTSNQAGCEPVVQNDQELPYQRWGGTLTGGYQLDRYNRLSLDFHVEHIDAELNEPVDDSGEPCNNYPFTGYLSPIGNGQTTYSSLTLRFERDTRNDFFLPTRGMYLNVSVELASKVLGSNYEFSKYLIQYEHSFPMWLDHAFRFSIVGGLIQDVGKWGSPFFARFFVGDHALFLINKHSLPRNLELNFSEVVDYGDALASFNVEYDIPLWSTGSFFYRGYTYLALNFSLVTKAEFLASDDEWSGRTKRPVSLDFGFKFDTPVGLLTLSFGYLMDLAF
jgi:outer membrane protein assembly factor BamA